MRRAVILPACFALAACGSMGDLKPAPGDSLPVKPALAARTPDASDLLSPPPDARPERIDELVTRSTPRAPDRFDLPPPEGGAAPEPDPITNIDNDGVDESDTTGPAPDIEKEDE